MTRLSKVNLSSQRVGASDANASEKLDSYENLLSMSQIEGPGWWVVGGGHPSLDEPSKLGRSSPEDPACISAKCTSLVWTAACSNVKQVFGFKLSCLYLQAKWGFETPEQT